ncbi:MAG: nitrate reductase molybdenum cofactor assembly chaperone [Herbaspirillum sp.]|jgi:hypothetical protein|nr:nitrate reductase molybdenum cofactor assembly chaperone [Herbaspirillum sp.]
MLGNVRKSAAQIQALDRIADWTRIRFSLSPEAAVLVSEVACSQPGCPPLETVVAFWENEQRHHFKFFKPALDVIEDDLPPYWMKTALIGDDWGDCC